MHSVHICILIEAARGGRKHIDLCRGSRRIGLWGPKEKEREQVYQLLGGGGGGSLKQNWTIKGDEAANQAGGKR